MTQTADPTLAEISGALATALHDVEVLSESMADLEREAASRDWLAAGYKLNQEFTRDGLANIARNCRIAAIASPLIKRGLLLRIGYVWGQGLNVEATDPDVNDVVQAFWDDPSNLAAFTGSQAQEENERVLGTDGNFFLALVTDRSTGRVQLRSTPFDEIADVIHNPEDRDDPWFYVRTYTTTVIEPGYVSGRTRMRNETRRVLHPAVGYRPASRPRSINGVPIEWDTPMLHVPVNRLDGQKWGIPDVYAALPWARAYEGFLTDWARLVKSLSKFAWRLSADRGSKAQRAAQKVAEAHPLAAGLRGDAAVGAVAAGGPGVSLEAIPKTGATVDSESGRPLAAMVAAGIGIPVTTLLADPGTTGARAVAETLDKPTVLEMGQRQKLWGQVVRTVLDYVIDQAVRANVLAGTTRRDPYTGREVVVLAGDAKRTLDIAWPPLDELDPTDVVTAISAAAGTRVVPDETIARLLLKALKVDDIDELLEPFFDDDGRWLPTAGQAAADRFDRGEDPAANEAYRSRTSTRASTHTG
jgi:ribosomal protein L12E/L44/L45/RPP1/RPP2